LKTLGTAAIALLVVGLAVLAAGCGSTKKSGAAGTGTSTGSSSSCAKGDLNLVSAGKLTVGTDNPAFPPWFGGNPKSPWKVSDPRSGKGFESAVAYAVAKQLGFSKSEVDWKHVPFSNSYAPGPKSFDFDINEISYTPARAKVVDFSDSYYDVNQSVVVNKGTPIASVTTVAGLKPYELGAQLGTTSYQLIQNTIKPSKKPSVFPSNTGAVQALKNKQIDGLVVDLPTAFYVTAVQVPNSKVLGQFPTQPGGEHFGMVFEKGNSLVRCVNQALAKLRSDGTLKQLQQQWLAKATGAPTLK
jgi:polar amino acid transport system substrate-binding protein